MELELAGLGETGFVGSPEPEVRMALAMLIDRQETVGVAIGERVIIIRSIGAWGPMKLVVLLSVQSGLCWRQSRRTLVAIVLLGRQCSENQQQRNYQQHKGGMNWESPSSIIAHHQIKIHNLPSQTAGIWGAGRCG